jgi:HPt (histidine-containing phosphotransfer) domain-containing protein
MYSLQELAGEVARLRQECAYFEDVLKELEQLSEVRAWLSDAQDDEIAQHTRTYAWSAKENLERATDDLRNWWRVVEASITERRTWLGH